MELSLPVVCITADNLAAGWEQAVVACWEQGARIPTQYDREGDQPSRDVSLFLAVKDHFAEPRIHRAMPGGFDDLEVYRQEVVDGIHDHWIAPEEGKWQYTYHERFARYTVPGIEQPIDQIQYVVDTLVETPHSRRAQAVIWKAWDDAGIDHPACVDLVRANAGAILYLAGQAPDLPSGVAAARELIFDGQAFAKLCQWVAVQADEAGAGRERFAAVAARAGLKDEVLSLI
jgi:hypothetical protein